MFNTDTVVLNAVADALQQTEGTLPVFWQNVCSNAHAQAYATIVQTLSIRGYTVSQISSWDYGASYELSLSVFLALQRGAALQTVDDRLVQSYDVREDLKTLVLIVGGAVVNPAGTTGQVVTGQESPANDIFQWPDQSAGGQAPPGPGLGQGTYW